MGKAEEEIVTLTPFVTLAQSSTPDGADLTLHERGGQFYLRLNNQPLMSTSAWESEKVLAELACKKVIGRSAPRILIGGLGFGFSLRRVLELVGKEAVVHVAELLPQVIAWNREFLGQINGKLLDDPRVQIFVEDVFQVIARSPAETYDAILLDVDNGPVAMVRDGNARLYHPPGFAVISRGLKTKGRVAFWSASDDKAFAKRLFKAGFNVEAMPAKAYPQARRAEHTIFVADRRG